MTDLAMTRADKAISVAQRRAERIRVGMHSFIATRREIAAAYTARDWVTLGYRSFDEYVDSEFSEARLRLSPDERRDAVAELRRAGMSTRAIGAAVGVSKGTVDNDLAQLANSGQLDQPERITGADGKDRPAARAERTQSPGPVDAAVETPPADPGVTPEPGAVPSAAQPGPVEPAPAADAPVPPQEPGPHLRLVPDSVTPPPGSPATWGPEEHEANRREVERKRAVEAAGRFAKSLVLEVRGMVTTIIDGLDYGAPVDLVTAEMIAECRAALDRLEARVTA